MGVFATLFGGFVYLDGLLKSLRSKRIVQIGVETESFAYFFFGLAIGVPTKNSWDIADLENASKSGCARDES